MDNYKPPQIMSIKEWVEKHCISESDGSPKPGPWRTSRTPYLREIMDEMSPHSDVSNIVIYARQCGNRALLYLKALLALEEEV